MPSAMSLVRGHSLPSREVVVLHKGSGLFGVSGSCKKWTMLFPTEACAHCPGGGIPVMLDHDTPAALVRLEVTAACAVLESSSYVLVLSWSRRRGSPYKATVLADDELVLRRLVAVETAGGRCRLSIHVSLSYAVGAAVTVARLTRRCCA